MFPPAQFNIITRETNKHLHLIRRNAKTKGEVIRFLGVIVLMTRYKFRASLLSLRSQTKYEVPANIRTTGMTRPRFDKLWRCNRFSEHPLQMPDGMSSEKYCWLLIDVFVDQSNMHHARTFVPSERFFVDESISKWYGKGGHGSIRASLCTSPLIANQKIDVKYRILRVDQVGSCCS